MTAGLRFARFIAHVGRPTNLAVWRIATAAAVLAAPETRQAARWAAVDPALRVPPPGLGAIVAHLPSSAALGTGALRVLQVSAALALIGLATRPALAVATVAAAGLLGFLQLQGSVTHLHHIVWFLALLAVSPAGDVLSVDALLRARRGEAAPSRGPLAFAIPLLAAWILMGAVFFFPGVWKLATSGVEWFWSDNLQNQLRAKWIQADFLPPVRIDRYPAVCRLAALAVVMFELSFPIAIWIRRLRGPAIWAAIAFHTLTAIFMRVSFPTLVAGYVALVDWEPILVAVWPRIALARAGRFVRGRPSVEVAAALVVAAVLVTGNLAAGALDVASWPFTVYPTFAARLGPEMPALGVDAVLADGTTVPLVEGCRLGATRDPQDWALGWSLLADPGEPRLRAYLAELARDPEVGPRLRGARAVRFSRDLLPLDPEAHGTPLRRATVAELPLP